MHTQESAQISKWPEYRILSTWKIGEHMEKDTDMEKGTEMEKWTHMKKSRYIK